MKKLFVAACTGSMFIMLTFLTAEETSQRKGGFFNINDNIQNEELRAELESLKNEFSMERERIRDHYYEKIKSLKDAQKKEVHIMKDEFLDRRKEIMKKYMGKMRDKPRGDSPKKMLNKPAKVKPPKEKMKKRKY